MAPMPPVPITAMRMCFSDFSLRSSRLVPARVSALRPIAADRIASVPADRPFAYRVEDAHAGRGRLGHLDDRAGMAFVQEIDERPARRVALLADLPAARQRALADLV